MKRLLFFSLIFCLTLTPLNLNAQSKTELALQQIQRDLADFQDRLKALQKSQDDRSAALQNLLQQALDGQARMATTVKALQTEVDTKLNEQQGKLVAPVATLGSKVDQMSDDFRAVSNTVGDLVRKLHDQDQKLTDISNAIRIMAANQAATQAPPPSASGNSSSPTTASNQCTGLTAEGLWEDARRDQTGGKLDLAMSAYQTYVKCFRESANAPDAQFRIAKMYYEAKQFDDAAKAFDDVGSFPENRQTQEALYYKALSLYNMTDHKTEAGEAFREYIAKYQKGEHVAEAHGYLQKLGLERRPPGKKKS